MGQWQCCSKLAMTSHSAPDKESVLDDPGDTGTHVVCSGPSGPDSAADSGHSSGDEGSSPGGVNGVKTANNNDPEGVTIGRYSHSSESSGKFSLRDSIGSSGDYDRSSNFLTGRIDECGIDLPVFAEENEEMFETLSPLHSPGALDRGETHQALQEHYLQHHYHNRKISRGSRGSSSSERGSFSSVTSVTAILKARLGRSASLVSQCDQPEAETHSTCSAVVASDTKRPQRTVSLRLSRSHQRSHDSDTNLPTIYVDDSPQQPNGRRASRKSSLQRALSLLSMNSFMKHEAATSSSSSQQKSQKPVQKILRQPRRRHNTVRGLSGLAIDGSNQGPRNPGLHRSHTVYYPTATSLRYAMNPRRTHSVTS